MKAFALAFILLSAGVSLASEEKEKPLATGITYYNFLELTRKAERILLGEIGESKDGAVMVKALETLKGPARDANTITPEKIKRAEELLNGGKSSIPPQSTASEPENVSLAVIPPAVNMLPRAGTQVIFFLWDAEKAADGKPLTYRINHPQCMYEASVLPQVRVALLKPRSIADGRYLRDRDQRLAEQAAQRKADEELKRNPGGAAVQGLEIEARRPKLMLKADNSFQVTSHLINRFTKEVAIYDGPATVFGAIVCRKDAPPESALVLRLNNFESIDPLALNITSFTDFDSIPGEKLLPHEHTFEASKFPALKALEGEHTVKLFYSNLKDGIKDGLINPAWTGTVVSKAIPLIFNKAKE